jgi:succinate dehydrogenase / fumarate reductase cytochrome b subunit
MYRGPSGMWSWLLHRISGLAILVFLFIHIVDISVIGFGPTTYNTSVVLFDQIIVRLLSLALIAAILYHALNGLRIMAIDFWRKGVRYQNILFIAVLVVTILVLIPVVYFVMEPAIPWFFHLPTASASH